MFKLLYKKNVKIFNIFTYFINLLFLLATKNSLLEAIQFNQIRTIII